MLTLKHFLSRMSSVKKPERYTPEAKQKDMSLVVRDAAGPAVRNGSIDHVDGNGYVADEERAYNPPPTSFSSPIQQQNIIPDRAVLDRGPNGLADFFSSEVFQIVLHNPTTAHRLSKFSQARMCGENMEFLEKVWSQD